MKEVLELEEILERSTPISRTQVTGVYFLIDKSVVVYVGQATQGTMRFLGHLKKEFDSYYFIECDKRDLNMIETFYIARFLLKYNESFGISYENQEYLEAAKYAKYNNVTAGSVSYVISRFDIGFVNLARFKNAYKVSDLDKYKEYFIALYTQKQLDRMVKDGYMDENYVIKTASCRVS